MASLHKNVEVREVVAGYTSDQMCEFVLKHADERLGIESLVFGFAPSGYPAFGG